MAVVTRRATRRDEDEENERPTRRRRSEDSEPEEERPARRSRRSGDTEDEKPTRSRRGSRSREEDDDDEKPTRSRRSRRGSEESGARRSSGGFASYSSKKRSTSSFADEFKPDSEKKVLIKILDAEPFDVFNQHFINELPKGERKSFVCLDDEEYFGDEADDGCPLCDLGDNPSTYSLFNIVDLSNPRKPEVKVWKTSPTVTDILERASREKKTSPLNREDLYFEVEMVKTKSKTTWRIESVKARDLPEDFDMDPLEDEEIAEFEGQRFIDRKAVTKVDTYDELDELADSL